MKRFLGLLSLALLLALPAAYGQATLTSTTLSSAVTSTSGTSIVVASATGFAAGRTAYVNREAMSITSVSGTTIYVRRGAHGTRASTHSSGDTVYVGPNDYFGTASKSGSCTSANELVLPVVDISTGKRYDCITSTWIDLTDVIEVDLHAQAATAMVDQTFFTANRAYQVIAIRQVHAVAETTAATLRVQVTKDTGTNAPGAGTDLITNTSNAGFDCKATANTVQTGTLITTLATLRLAAGDRLGADFTAAATELVGLTITVTLKPL